jgi:large subunit ribosomal protein L30
MGSSRFNLPTWLRINAERVWKRSLGNYMNKSGKIRVTLKSSLHGRLKKHKACLKGLGLSRIGQTVEVLNTPENCGMIFKVNYLLRVEECE